jgi:hypothetical protein
MTKDSKIGDAGPEQVKVLSSTDLEVLQAIAQAAEQYDAYIQLSALGDLGTLRAANETTWQHDPKAPLSLELIPSR